MTKQDYIHLFKEACAGKCNAEYNPCAFRQAADSLATLDPVAWRHKHGNEWHYMGKDDPFPPDGWEPLYVIEVTK